jgi:hypothetical protein
MTDITNDDNADIYTGLPCMFCQDDRAVAVKLRLGRLYLRFEQNNAPALPSRAELLRGCCRHIRTAQHAPLW